MATFSASGSFSSDQLVFSGATGPHKDVSYPFSLVCWFYGDVSGGSKYPIAINDYSARDIWIGVRTNGNNLYISVAAAAAVRLFSVGSINSNQWYFCVLECNASNDRRMYLDGAKKGSTDTQTEDILAQQANLDRSSIGNLSITDGGELNFYWDGLIAYPAIYDKALSLDEQAEIMSNPFGIVDSLIWAPDLLVSGSVVGDYIDRSGIGYNPNVGSIPSTSGSGPPVHF